MILDSHYLWYQKKIRIPDEIKNFVKSFQISSIGELKTPDHPKFKVHSIRKKHERVFLINEIEITLATLEADKNSEISISCKKWGVLFAQNKNKQQNEKATWTPQDIITLLPQLISTFATLQ